MVRRIMTIDALARDRRADVLFIAMLSSSGDVISHIKIELPTTQLAAASTLLASLKLI